MEKAVVTMLLAMIMQLGLGLLAHMGGEGMLPLQAPDIQHLTTIEDSLVEMVKGTVIQQSMEKYGVNITRVQLLSTMPLEPEVFIPSATITHNAVPLPFPQPPPPAVVQIVSPTGTHGRNKVIGIIVGVIGGSMIMACVVYLFTVRLRNRKWGEVVGEAEQSMPSLQSPLKSDVSSEDQKPQKKSDSAHSDQLLRLRSTSQFTKSPQTPGRPGAHTPVKWCHVRAEYGGPAITAVSSVPSSGVSRADIRLWSPPAGPPPDRQYHEEQGSDEEFENEDRISRSQMASTSCGIELPQVPLSDWLIRSEEIVICRRPDGSLYELGTGAFGKVYKAVRGEVQHVAVKVLKNKEEHATFGREIAILKNCRHPNIVQFQGACEKDGQIMLVTEFMESGDLFRALQKKVMQGPNKWSKCGQRIALDIARGLCYLHDKKIVHLDLKSNNILLSRDGTAKIADVGLSKVLTGAYLSNPDVRGTMAYSAPELLMGGKCCEKADIYSLGVVFWEIATNERPIRGQLREVNPEQDHVPPALGAIIADCLASDSKDRPSARQVYDRLSALVPPPRTQRQQATPPQTITNFLGPTPEFPNPLPTPLNIPNEFFPRPRNGLAVALAAASRGTNPTPSAASSTANVLAQQRKPQSPFAAHSTALSSQQHAVQTPEPTKCSQTVATTSSSQAIHPAEDLVHPSPFAQLTHDPFSSGSNDLNKATQLRRESHDADS